MNYISVENLTKRYGEKILFEGLNFGLSKGDKMALIANNGTGKSSLLKILVGKDQSDGGKIAIRNGLRVSFLDQDPVFEKAATIRQHLQGANSEVLAVINEYNTTLQAQEVNFNSITQKAFEIASAKMDEFEAWDYDRKVIQILSKFGISDLDQSISNLSGGQKKRLALAIVLLDHPDLFILDEPTNHLDVEMIEWLEKYLLQQSITLLMVTHDRYFLDRVCNHILELTDGKLYHHHGNYSWFLEKRAEREEVFNIDIEKSGKLMRKELEWMRRMPKARTTKSKARIDSFYEIEEKANSKKVQRDLTLEVKMSRIGGKILELKKVYKSYGDLAILKGFDYSFKRGERIGVIGKNGVGKSTFLNIITGREQADSGKVNTGETIVYGYYSQQGITLNEDKRVIEVVKDIADVIVLADGTKLGASQFLQQFLFPPEMQYTYVSKLSGGERRRLYLLTVLIKNPNFLILDEPTNDLDLLTLNKLEEFLLNYPGCVIIVSHDRYFMDKLIDHLFVFKGDGEIKDFPGTYTEYRNKEEEKDSKPQKLKQNEAKIEEHINPEKEKVKLSFKEKFEYESLEKEIGELEKEKTELESIINQSSSNYELISKSSERIGNLITLIDAKTERWLELAEYV